MLDANKILKRIEDLLPFIDYLITSEAFLYEYSKSKNIENGLIKLKNLLKPEILVTTLGDKGSITLINDNLVYVDSFKVTVFDTTGAGDVYHGAFLFGILKGWEIKNIMIFSSAVAALKCMRYGGIKGIPDYKTVIDFLKEKKINIDRFK
jgi:sulfofructose kinase